MTDVEELESHRIRDGKINYDISISLNGETLKLTITSACSSYDTYAGSANNNSCQTYYSVKLNGNEVKAGNTPSVKIYNDKYLVFAGAYGTTGPSGIIEIYDNKANKVLSGENISKFDYNTSGKNITSANIKYNTCDGKPYNYSKYDNNEYEIKYNDNTKQLETNKISSQVVDNYAECK